MEKRIAHYPLNRVKNLVEEGCVRTTRTALEGAAKLDFNFNDMKEIIGNLEATDFYKSMTSNQNQSLWQDVYRYPAEVADIYIKIQIVKDDVIISFKEL